MQRKRMILLFAALLCFAMLCSCRLEEAPVMEFVGDTIPAMGVAEEIYDITVSVPPDAQDSEAAQAFDTSEKIFRPEDGRYEIETKTLLADSPQSAVHQLSGFSAEELAVVQTTRFSMPEYRFAWFSADGADGWVCRADAIRDGDRYYCVICRVRESARENCGQLATEVFSTIGLFTDEGA